MTVLTVTYADDDDGVKAAGQWRRKGENGPPIVTDPNGEANVGGQRKGLVKLRTYSRPSNFGKQVENTYNLDKWNERQVARGVALFDTTPDPDPADNAKLIVLATGDPDDPAWKQEADGLVVEAKRRAGAMLAADRGTHGHHLTEDHDLDVSVITRIERGEDLGLSPALQAGVVEVWRRLIEEHFEVLAVEFPCVFDAWRVGGTGDRIVRLKHDLVFELADGRVIVIPKGTVLVLDIKTGGLKTTPAGLPMYWHSYAVQVAAYALGVPYDVDTEKRGTWPWSISAEHAVIAHIDIAGALDTDVVTAQLIYVDLVAGREAGDLVCAAKAWQNRKDIFSPAGSYLAAHTITAEATCEPSAASTTTTPPATTAATSTSRSDGHTSADPAGNEPSAKSDGGSPTLSRADVVDRARALVEAGHALRLSYVWPEGVPGFKSDHAHTEAELRLIYTAVCEVEDEQGVSPGFVEADMTLETPPRHMSAERAGELPPLPAAGPALSVVPDPCVTDEGGTVDDDALAALRAAVGALLIEQQLRIETIVGEAKRAGVPISLRELPSVRRFEIARALLSWVQCDDLNDGDLCELAAVVQDRRYARTTPPGALVGALTIDQAKRLADMVTVPAT